MPGYLRGGDLSSQAARPDSLCESRTTHFHQDVSQDGQPRCRAAQGRRGMGSTAGPQWEALLKGDMNLAKVRYEAAQVLAKARKLNRPGFTLDFLVQ